MKAKAKKKTAKKKRAKKTKSVRFVPEVTITLEQPSGEAEGIWHQKFTLTDPSDTHNPRPVDHVGAKLDLTDPDVLAEQWAKFEGDLKDGD